MHKTSGDSKSIFFFFLSLTWSTMYSAEPEAEVVGEERGGLDQADARGALPNSCVWK